VSRRHWLFLKSLALALALTICFGLLSVSSKAQTRSSDAKQSLLQVHLSQGNCLTEGLLEDLQAPPIPINGKPLAVTVRMHIDEIPDISSTQDNFTVNGVLAAAWCDSRLAASLLPHEQERVYAQEAAGDFLTEHWDPQITFANELGASEGDDLMVSVHRSGVVEFRRRALVKLQSNFDLQRFPFDHQTLELNIQSFAWDDRVLRVSDLSSLSLSNHYDIPEWRLERVQSSIGPFKDPDHDRSPFSRLHVGILVERQSEFYLYKIFAPLAVLTFTSIFFLAIPIDNMGDRVAFVSGLLFTNLAYQLIIASSVPKVPYFTLGDRYTLFLFFFMVVEVFIAYGMALITRLGVASGPLTPSKIEAGFEISLPIVFVLVHVWFLSMLHHG